MFRVKQAEKERLRSIKKEIEEEEKKIRKLKQQKNLEIQMGRKLALSTAELRNEIRLTEIILSLARERFLLKFCLCFLDAVRNWICVIDDDTSID